MTSLLQDLRYAVRQLLRTPGFTAAAVLTLAFGIAVNTAFFAIVNAVVFRPVRSIQLDGVYQPSFEGRGRGMWQSMPLAHFRALEASLPSSVEAVDAQATATNDVVVHIPGRAERVEILGVSGGHAAVFRLQPQAGRFITADDDHGRARAAVISDRLWREWFGGDPAVDRATIRIDGDVFQIVGVAPPGYRGPAGFGMANTDVWVPLSHLRRPRALDIIVTYLRLEPGVRPESAAPQVLAAIKDTDAGVPAIWQIGDRRVSLSAAVDGNPFRGIGIALLWLSSFVLIAACANLANMLYVRAAHRRAEMAVRQALGATTGRIFRLLLIEALTIGVMATGLGLVLALAATRQFRAAFPLFRDRATRMTIDLKPDYFVFAYAFAAGVAAALLVGGVSAWRASRVPPLRGMAVGDAATSVTRTSRRTRLGLVALQVGAAVVLLMSAGLFYRQTTAAFSGTLLFDTAPLATARLDLARHGYNAQTARAFLRRLRDDVASLPGVDEAAVSDGVPGGMYMGGAAVTFAAERPDLPYSRYITPSNRRVDGTLVAASPGFLQTLGLRVHRGRDLSHADRDGAELAVVVSRSMAEGLWPGSDALGRRLMFGNDGHWRTVVGIADDPARRRVEGPRERLFDPARLVVSPIDQRYPTVPEAAETRERVREVLVVLRSPDARGQLDALRARVTALDPGVALFDAATVDESILAAMAPVRAGRLLMGTLAGVALGISTLGVFGVVSFLVARRRREFGIRIALGAQRGQVLKMVMDEATYLLLVGLFAGVFIAAVGERLIDTRTFGLLPNEISTWVAVLLLILTVGLAAALLPARRAASVDPNIALRDL